MRVVPAMGRLLLQLRRAVVGLLVLAVAAVPVCAAEELAPLPCGLKFGAGHTVVAIKDGLTIVIDDGSVVRLSGILPPFAPRAGQAQDIWAPEKDAIEALGDLVLGRAVRLAFVRPKRDRYGTVQAHVFVEGAANDFNAQNVGATKSDFGGWVQARLLSLGHARAFEPGRQSECFGLLMSFEMRARRSGLGLWAHPAFRSIPAGDIGKLWKLRGSYVRVRGRIRTVARRSTLTYLNFGDDWRTDFTISVPRVVARKHPKWAAQLGAMAMRNVEIVGWIRARNGPSIEIEHPSQLQLEP